jgi:hypothetical protein
MSQSRIRFPNLLTDGVTVLAPEDVPAALDQTHYVYKCIVPYAHLFDNLGAPAIQVDGSPGGFEWVLGTRDGVVVIWIADQGESEDLKPKQITLHSHTDWDVYAESKEAADAVQRYLNVELT